MALQVYVLTGFIYFGLCGYHCIHHPPHIIITFPGLSIPSAAHRLPLSGAFINIYSSWVFQAICGCVY